MSFHSRIHLSKFCLSAILDKNVEKNGLCHVQFQDNALESIGNYKYYHFPQKDSVEVQLDHF